MNIVKYPGGKERELDIIQQFRPETVRNYYEPFVGGGAVYLAMPAERYFVNDISEDLMNLYQCVARQDEEFFSSMKEINGLWKSIDSCIEEDKTLFSIYTDFRNGNTTEESMLLAIDEYIKKNKKKLLGYVTPMQCGNTEVFMSFLQKDLGKKYVRMKELHFNKKQISDADITANIIGILKASFYMYIRSLYGHMGHYTNGFKAMLYLFIRDFCYSSMFRFNSDGGFNVPYGGISYNGKTYDKVLEKYQNKVLINQMQKTIFGCEDYMSFLEKYPPEKEDFMFVDPPYDTFFSTYDQKSFDVEEQKRLATYLLEKCPCNFMLDIKYTDFIGSLYPEGHICANGNPLHIVAFDKNYSVSFMNRNGKKVTHMLVMNYQRGDVLC